MRGHRPLTRVRPEARLGAAGRAAGVGAVSVQRLRLPDGEVSWTVLGEDWLAVAPVEELLEYLRTQRHTPNTVRNYAHGLARCWQFWSDALSATHAELLALRRQVATSANRASQHAG